MTKAELIEHMAAKAGITKAEADRALTAITDSIVKSLKPKNGKITLTGLGSFYKSRRKARTGRNPRTGEPLKIKATNVVRFKPSQKLKGAI